MTRQSDRERRDHTLRMIEVWKTYKDKESFDVSSEVLPGEVRLWNISSGGKASSILMKAYINVPLGKSFIILF